MYFLSANKEKDQPTAIRLRNMFGGTLCNLVTPEERRAEKEFTRQEELRGGGEDRKKEDKNRQPLI